MTHSEGIHNPGDLEKLLRELLTQMIAREDGSTTRGLQEARVFSPSETMNPGFIVRLADGRQHEVIVKNHL